MGKKYKVITKSGSVYIVEIDHNLLSHDVVYVQKVGVNSKSILFWIGSLSGFFAPLVKSLGQEKDDAVIEITQVAIQKMLEQDECDGKIMYFASSIERVKEIIRNIHFDRIEDNDGKFGRSRSIKSVDEIK
tara:strand:- start:1491 stop:1883 length:393 start_codon:yes stop_codon:yes gene_type:complete